VISPQVNERDSAVHTGARGTGPEPDRGSLEQELRHGHSQLQLPLDLTARPAGGQDPEAAQAELSGRRGTMLQSAAIYLCTLVNAIDAKDHYTSAHSERVGGLARLTGEALGLSKEQIQALECSGLLHDVGKIGVAEQILNKPGALTPAEFEEMKKHAQVGYDMLRPVAQFQPILSVVLHHHENHDGSGYPAGLAGEAIPLGARIIHVVDIFDALTTHRPYRKAYDSELALRVIEAGAGRATDPKVTELFIEALRRHMTEHPADFRARFGHLEKGARAARCVN
jgi:HD-GYP domain-containing protein (c-di-GMP phosphodiesterase class II)